MLDDRSADLGAFVRPPERSLAAPKTFPVPRQAEKQPPTLNPAPDELAFVPADPTRDVAARLDAFLLEDVAAPDDPNLLRIDLVTALQIGQDTAREFLTAQEDYILAAIRLLIEQRGFETLPFNSTTARIEGGGTDGRFDTALSVVNELGLTRRFQNGSEVAASWLVEATEDLREGISDRYTNSSRLAVSGRFPLLRGAGLAASESLIQASRDVVYAARAFERFRRTFLVDIATDYFGLVEDRAAIMNSMRQIEALRAIEEETAAKIEAGLLRDFQRAIASSDRLAAEAALAGARDAYRLSEDRFKVRLGLPLTTPIVIMPTTIELPYPDIDLAEATRTAIELRLDLQTDRDLVLDARRGVSVARNDVLPDLDIDARIDLPTDPDVDVGNLSYDFGELSYSAGITLNLPLDRRIERLNLRSAVIGVEQAIRAYELSRDDVAVEARAAARDVELARFQLTLAEQQVEINRRRQRGQELDPENVTTQERVDTQNELLDSENARDAAVADLRIAILEYLLATGVLRVSTEGEMEPIGDLIIGPEIDPSLTPAGVPDGVPAGSPPIDPP
ncbi:MAG: TolC family protein [Planctomycetota bacterium]